MGLMVRLPADAEERGFIVGLGASIVDGLALTSTVDRIVLNIEIAGDPVDHPWSDDPALPAPQLPEFDDTPLKQRVFNFQGGFQID